MARQMDEAVSKLHVPDVLKTPPKQEPGEPERKEGTA
jgi:hypothetical protein